MELNIGNLASTNNINVKYEPRITPQGFLPQRMLIVANGDANKNYPAGLKENVTSIGEIKEIYGAGSPIALMAQQALAYSFSTLDVYAVENNPSSVVEIRQIVLNGTPANGRITVKSDSLTALVDVTASDTIGQVVAKVVDAVNNIENFPFIVSNVGDDLFFAVKWAGADGAEIDLSIDYGQTTLTGSVSVDVAGSGLIDYTTAIDSVQDKFYTAIVPQTKDSVTIDAWEASIETKIANFEDYRGGIVYYADDSLDQAALITLGTNNRNKKFLSYFNNKGKNNSKLGLLNDFEVSTLIASYVCEIAEVNPAESYSRVSFDTIKTGENLYDYNQRDALVKAGIGTFYVSNGLFYVQDVITTNHPANQDEPPYRYVAAFQRLLNIADKIYTRFGTEKWKNTVRVKEGDIVTNPKSRTLGDVRAEMYSLIDSLGSDGLIYDIDLNKQGVNVSVNASNSRRIDVDYNCVISVNNLIINVNLKFSY